ncbi:MAG: DUF420 domain-containing protein [Planctomycetes bacterium]|nr:DUF420 domain-containing protein [Planctomycetota bacterium]
MLDFVAVAMLIIMPVQAYSIYLVKKKRLFPLHRRIQIITSIVLFSAVIVFEVNMRLYGWKHMAEPSIYYDTLVYPSLYVHLFFSILTPFFWFTALIQGLRKFGRNPEPNDYSSRHKVWGWLAFSFLLCTTITGGVFYVLAYIC